MKEYMLPSIINMIHPTVHWQSGWNILSDIENKIQWPRLDQVTNERVVEIMEYLYGKQYLLMKKRNQNTFKNMANLYFAKFLYVNDLPLNDDSLTTFITDFFGKEIAHDCIKNSLSDCHLTMLGVSIPQLLSNVSAT